MTIGERISAKRKQKGYSQEYVAERLNVSRQAVSKWETDATAPDTHHLIALAELLDTEVSYLAVGAEPPLARQTRPLFILGYIFLSAGLLALLLGVLLSSALILPAVALILGAILCLWHPKRLLLVSLWCYWGLWLAHSFFMSRPSPFWVFSPNFYRAEFTVYHVVSLLFWLLLLADLAVTIVSIVRARKAKERG